MYFHSLTYITSIFTKRKAQIERTEKKLKQDFDSTVCECGSHDRDMKIDEGIKVLAHAHTNLTKKKAIDLQY